MGLCPKIGSDFMSESFETHAHNENPLKRQRIPHNHNYT